MAKTASPSKTVKHGRTALAMPAAACLQILISVSRSSLAFRKTAARTVFVPGLAEVGPADSVAVVASPNTAASKLPALQIVRRHWRTGTNDLSLECCGHAPAPQTDIITET
eukprot:GHVU01064327.1.p2 GENE.GHVU01064327.1~~GHVU01064327.1.p2  ORF type:complete len:111 (+),score=7.97 GHVU01064327.1:742-1074(+)